MTNFEQSSQSPDAPFSPSPDAPFSPDQRYGQHVSLPQVGGQHGEAALQDGGDPLIPGSDSYQIDFDFSGGGTSNPDSGGSTGPARRSSHQLDPFRSYTRQPWRHSVRVILGLAGLALSCCGASAFFTSAKKVPDLNLRRDAYVIPERRGEAAVLNITVQIVYGPQAGEFFSSSYRDVELLSLLIEQPSPEESNGRRFTLPKNYYDQFDNLLAILVWMYEDALNNRNEVRTLIEQYLQSQADTYNTGDAFLRDTEMFLSAYDVYIAQLQELGPNQTKDDLLRFFAQERKRYYRQLLQSESLHDSERDEIRRLLRILDDLVGIYKSHNYFQTDGVSLRESINEETFFWKIFSQPPPPRV